MVNNSFAAYLQSKGLSQSTIRHYQTYADDFNRFLDRDAAGMSESLSLDHCTSKEVVAYLNYLKKPVRSGGRGLESNTRVYRLNVIRHLFAWLVACGKRSNNPAQHIRIRGGKRQKMYSILKAPELLNLYNSYELPSSEDPRQNRNWWAKYELSRRRNKVTLGMLIHQGLTTAEVDRLTASDLKLKEGTVFIAGTRKSNERILELKSSQIFEILEYQEQVRPKLLKLSGKQSQQFFVSIGTSSQSNSNWRRFAEVLRGENSKFINFKQVRASVITHWLGLHDLRQVQYMAGHRFISSTEAYRVNQVDDLLRDVDRFHPLGDLQSVD